MDQVFSFSTEEEKRISGHFGEEFLHTAIERIQEATVLWGLSDIRLIESFSANLVLVCNAVTYGRSIMKIARPSKWFIAEVKALIEMDDAKVCQLYAYDLELSILLEEAIEPGTRLREEASIDLRLANFLHLYKSFHKATAGGNDYPTYGSWVNNITNYMSKQTGHYHLSRGMKKAKGLYDQLSRTYNSKRLLHGDFHHDNILLGNDGMYRIIDPKGVIGDPIFDLPRYILNEFMFVDLTDDLFNDVCRVIKEMSQQLNIPAEVIQQCTYIETMMGTCWCIESGIAEEELPQHQAKVAFAKRLLETTIVVGSINDGGQTDSHWMSEAIAEGHRAGDLLEVPIGAVIVHEGQIIGRGFNQRNTKKSTLGHAEILAIEQASAAMDDWRLEGCTMYVTVEPCPMCAGAIVQARMDRVVIGTMNAKAGCAGSIYNLLQDQRFNHQVDIDYGVMEEECSEMMSEFFRQLRAQKKFEKEIK